MLGVIVTDRTNAATAEDAIAAIGKFEILGRILAHAFPNPVRVRIARGGA